MGVDRAGTLTLGDGWFTGPAAGGYSRIRKRSLAGSSGLQQMCANVSTRLGGLLGMLTGKDVMAGKCVGWQVVSSLDAKSLCIMSVAVSSCWVYGC